MNGYNQSPFANITPVVKNLLIINIILFIGVNTMELVNINLYKWLGGYYFNAPNFHLWSFISYMFLHADYHQPAHIIFNMFALFSFGPILEQTLGSKKFFNFYFICGIGAMLCQMLVQAYEVHAITGGFTLSNVSADPQDFSAFAPYGMLGVKLYSIYNVPIVGASGAIFGLLVGFGMLYPNLEMMVLFIPVPVKAKYIIPAYIVFELYMGLNPMEGDSVAHYAHLGGALVGFLMIKIWRLQRPNNFY
ncbi:rhomboid family intramembrane serine protease [Mucilaginibacter celer]|uniref:Rhomboid family intramembrane serine protease n=1 Tax=Mucilaginibacter celer TaxID=2305508 RepID=A0A494W551_9SPHI|nr:rhomboid family intramembrane serine protease [Mucilaginibacter celer]AYL98625.1 rhomboid family intramembrane serine protease [Mucilaginibacter celer]